MMKQSDTKSSSSLPTSIICHADLDNSDSIAGNTEDNSCVTCKKMHTCHLADQQDIINFKLQFARQQEMLDNLSLKLSKCEVEINALKTKNAVLEEDGGKVQSLDVTPPLGNMILAEESSTSLPTSVEEFSVLEYCKKDRSKEVKLPCSNHLTRQKSLRLAEETTPRHEANDDVVVDDADIEGPRDEATRKGTAWLKKVLGVVDDDGDDDCHSPRDVPADAGAEVEATPPSTDAHVPAVEDVTCLRESSRSEESPPSSEYSNKDRSKESTWSEHVERRWNSQDTEITTNTRSAIGENSEDDGGAVDDCNSPPHAILGDAVVDVEAAVDATTPSTDADLSADHYTQAIMEVLCSEEIVRIMERAVHQELMAMRMDRSVIVDTAKPCVRSDVDDSTTSPRCNVQGVLGTDEVTDVNDDSSLKAGCNKQGRLQSQDVTLIQEESSSLPISVEESSLSESSKDSSKELPQATWKSQNIEQTTDTKSLIGKNADNNDGGKISVLGWGDISNVHDSSSETATTSSLTMSMLPYIGNTSRSVNNASVALACALHYVERDRRKDPVDMVLRRSGSRGSAGSAQRTSVLLVHRLPIGTLPEHISEMFLEYASIRPKSVKKISFLGPLGKCYVEFMTSRHAEMAYDALVGEEWPDSYGNVQKTVKLKGGGTLGVRKMTK